jgi:sialic acid synthase SpsE
MKDHLNHNNIFHDLFVLELANNHLGNVERALKIIMDFSQVVRFNNIRATIKLQFRDVDTFIHKDHIHRDDMRYIKKTRETRMTSSQYATLVQAVKRSGCLTSATPFDEASVDLCEQLDLDMIKLASSDINDWFLIEKIARTKKPVSFSTGGSSQKDIDDIVKFFTSRNILIALNHCVSNYPTEDHELELNQLDYLRNRYPGVTIGLSTHEFRSWDASMLIAYAKGARIFERHIDIDSDGVAVSAYNSLPHQIDAWFKAFKKAKEMCGGSGDDRRFIPEKEVKYLDALVRGVYAKRDLPVGFVLNHLSLRDDFYLAIPLLKGQLSCREIMNGEVLSGPLRKDEPLTIDLINSPYSKNEQMKQFIYARGL